MYIHKHNISLSFIIYVIIAAHDSDKLKGGWCKRGFYICANEARSRSLSGKTSSNIFASSCPNNSSNTHSNNSSSNNNKHSNNSDNSEENVVRRG